MSETIVVHDPMTLDTFFRSVGVFMCCFAGVLVLVIFGCFVLNLVAERVATTLGIYDAMLRTIWDRAREKRDKKESPNDE